MSPWGDAGDRYRLASAQGEAVKPRGLKSLRFVVPGIPAPCERARTGITPRKAGDPRPPKRHTYTPDKTAAYEQAVGMRARVAAAGARWQPTKGSVFALDARVYRDTRTGDWDNFGKAICDALTKARVWPDDRYVVDGRVRLYIDRANPRAEIVVTEMREGACLDCVDWAPAACPFHHDGREEHG